MKSLYIFVTSDRPDQYLNSIVYCIKKGINHIVFVQVEDNKLEQIQLNLLRHNVYSLLQSLSLGYYKYFTGSLKNTSISLDTEYPSHEIAKIKAYYSSCLTDNIIWEIERIKYLKLKQYIFSLEKRNKDLIIDVTSVSKAYIGDIFACCLLKNIGLLCTFELLVKPDFNKPWKTLIHNLEEGKQYNYTNLVETPIFKESVRTILIRTTPLLISIVGAIIFVALALAATFILGSSSVFIQTVSIVGTVLGIISFFLIYFPVRDR